MIIDLDRDFLLHGTVFSDIHATSFVVEHGMTSLSVATFHHFPATMLALLEDNFRSELVRKARESMAYFVVRTEGVVGNDH